MRRILWLVLAAPFFPSSALGWGCAGHQIVAMIARAHLTPTVSAAVDALLKSGPIDAALNRNCTDPADPMVDVTTWADDVRNSAKTGLWHYVDIPLSVTRTGGSVDAWCPDITTPPVGQNWPGCVTKAIDYNVAVVKDQSRTASDRASALRYVIHLVGDIHQPLHAEDNDDQGGNCTSFQVFKDERPSNLHSIWDSRLIQRSLDDKSITVREYAGALDSRFTARFGAMSSAKADDPVTWSWGSHAFALSAAYGNLQPAIPVEKPDPQLTCQMERDKVTALHISIDDVYYEKAIAVIEEQLATAGYRLAYLLNSLF